MKKLKRILARTILSLGLFGYLMSVSVSDVQAANTSYPDANMFADSYNIKGMQGAHRDTKNSFGGLEHSLINVHLDDAIFSPTSDFAKNGWVYTYEFEGETFYFTDYPLGMTFVPNCNDSGMSISVVFLLRWNDGYKDSYNNDTNFLIDAASREPGHNYYAPNVDLSTYGGRAIRAYWHYLMDWLAENGYHIDNFILGNEVNMPNHWHYSASTDVNVVATKYADAFYYMYEAVREYTDISRCSISIDHSWNHNDEGRGIGARNFLHVFHNRLSQYSKDVDWCVSAHLYPALLYNTRIWEHPYGLTTNSSDTQMVDGTNLSAMTNYIRDTFGPQHRIMLTEQGFTNNCGAEAQAACLAYTYYAAMYDPMVDCFLINVENAGGQLDFRIDGTLAGTVYTKIGNGNAADQQWIASVCLPIIGVSSWEEIIPNFGIVKKIQFPGNETLNVNEKKQLNPTIYPSHTADQGLIWKSSNNAVAWVDANGVVTAVAPGSATITATAKYANEVSASCTVNVIQKVNSITLDKQQLSLKLADTYKLTAKVNPANATNPALSWKSSNPAVATVDANGLVKAVASGSTIITVAAQDGSGVSASCAVTVTQPVKSINLNKTTLDLKISEKYTLIATVSPTNATNKKVNWTSSDETVAIVDQKGKVSAVGVGSATITATACDGSGVSGSCAVTTSIEEGNPFYDVPSNQWYYPYVKKAYENGLMVGSTTHAQTGLVIFKPESYMTRAMFVQVLYSMEGKPEVTYKNVFSDIPDPAEDANAWYSYAVLWAAENGITSGKPDGTFGVNGLVTREEMALMLMKYAKMKDYDISGRADISGFLDESSVSSWAKEAMQWAVYNGVIAGKPAEGGNILKPQGNAWRAEGATMLSSFHEKFE